MIRIHRIEFGAWGMGRVVREEMNMSRQEAAIDALRCPYPSDKFWAKAEELRAADQRMRKFKRSRT